MLKPRIFPNASPDAAYFETAIRFNYCNERSFQLIASDRSDPLKYKAIHARFAETFESWNRAT
jgi:hypothetical protein